MTTALDTGRCHRPQVTHDAPYGIFDMTGGGHWGSSQELLGAIYRTKPKVRSCG